MTYISDKWRPVTDSLPVGDPVLLEIQERLQRQGVHTTVKRDKKNPGKCVLWRLGYWK